MPAWKNLFVRYEQELLENVIPFWEKHCVDQEFGGYFNCLDRDGKVFDGTKNIWMQWRIVYMFATLYCSRYRQDRWLEIARHGYDFLTRYGKSESGGYCFALSRQGQPLFPSRMATTECYAAMGAAAMYRATGEEKYRREVESCMALFYSRYEPPRGGDAAMPRHIHQGTYMMAACLGGVMRDTLGKDLYPAESQRAATMILERFRHPQYLAMLENIRSDGTYNLSTSEGRHVTSGHGFESMWFILHYAEQHGLTQFYTPAANAIREQFEFCWDRECGGLYASRDILNLPDENPIAEKKVWWMHNEAVLAALYAYRLTGDASMLSWFERIDEWSWNHFPDPEFGEWFPYLDRAGQPTHFQKGGHMKSFFHLPRCLYVGLLQIEAIIAREFPAEHRQSI